MKSLKFCVCLFFALVCAGCIKLKKPSASTAPPAAASEVATVKAWNLDKVEIQGFRDIELEGIKSLPLQLIRERGEDVLLLNAREIIFHKDSVLKIGARNLKIAAEVLRFEPEAVIKSFDSADKAKIDRPGQSAGRIEMEASSAEGSLSVILNGENGGDGSPGEAPGSELAGTAGLPGNNAYFLFSQMTQDLYCNHPPTQGTPGGPGQPGYRGQDGQAGGNSGNIFLQINDQKNFKLQISEKREGKGGRGGAGGAGGLPGPKGPDGQWILSEQVPPPYRSMSPDYLGPIVCPRLKSIDPTIPPGSTGPTGEPGPDGKK